MIGTVGTVYLIHFDRPYKHAKHYVGWAKSLEARIAHHRNGTGARLLQVLNEAGIGWEVVRTWPNTTREFERHLKDTRHVSHYCPRDQPERAAARREARKEKEMEIKTTLGELVTEMDEGNVSREQVKAAVAELSADGKAIHWGAEVARPEAEIEDFEIELG